MKKDKKTLELLMSLFPVLVGVYGLFGCLLSVVPVQYDAGKFYCLLIIFSIIFTLIFNRRIFPYTGVALLIILSGYGVWVFLEREEVYDGILVMEQAVLDRVNEVYNINLVLSISVSDADPAIALTTMAVMLVMLVAYSCVYTYHKSILAILYLLPFAGALLLNQVPPVLPLCLCILSFVCIMAGEAGRKGIPHYIQRKSVLMMLVLGMFTAVLAVAVTAVGNSQKASLHSLNSVFREFVNDHLWSRISHLDEYFVRGNSQSVLDGSLNRKEGFTYTGARALEVTLSSRPEQTVYLKGYIGAEYEGDRWGEDNSQDFYEYARANDWNVDQETTERDIINLPYHTDEVSGNMRADTMSLERYTASALYTYYPYNVLLPESMNALADGTVEGVEGTQWEFPCYMPSTYTPEDYESNYLAGSPWENLEDLYDTYVQNAYLDYPSEQLPRLTAQCQQSSAQSLREITDFVTSTLREGAVYNLNVGETPQGEDFTEYFLYENQKEGYCVHFATAAVLMFRMKGIPARYVAGYVAPANSFELGEDGLYHSMVRDQRAHAWAEIYISGYGWLPVETTPGYVTAGILVDEGQQSETTDEQTEPNSTQIVQETTTPIQQVTVTETPEAEAAAVPVQNFRWGVGAIAALSIVTALLILILWRVGWILYRRSIFRGSSNKAASFIFYTVYDVLKDVGLPAEIPMSEPEFTEEMLKRCPGIQKEELDQFINIAMEAGFGGKTIQRHQVMEMRRTYMRICRSVYRNLSPVGKLRFRFWKVYF